MSDKLEDFAKLYNTTLGQILVKLDSNEEEDMPEVRLYFTAPGLGVNSLALGFTDNDNNTAWDKAEAAFRKITEEQAFKMIKGTIDDLGLSKFG